MSEPYSASFERYRKVLDRLERHDLRVFDIPRSARILDVGCGFGDDVRKLRRLGYASVAGTDPDPYCVEKCGLPEVRVGSITQTGLPDASFDAVLAHNVFHHIPDYGAALQELFRILRPKGLLCFIEPRNSTWRRVMDYLTFSTPLPRWVPSVRLRYEVMEQERATGLYPQWLRSQKKFFSLLEKGFQVLWLKKEFLFLVGKAEKREGASLCSPS